MFKKLIMSTFILLSMLYVNQALAYKPNLYTCKGANVSLTYVPTGIGPHAVPDPVLISLSLGNKVYKATATNIETSRSVMGDIKSVTYHFLPDVFIKKASFIVPSINLGKNGFGQFVNKVSFNSQLALTTIATPFIAGPYLGIVNDSKYIDLVCTAADVLLPL